jgi:hypothetical protein
LHSSEGLLVIITSHGKSQLMQLLIQEDLHKGREWPGHQLPYFLLSAASAAEPGRLLPPAIAVLTQIGDQLVHGGEATGEGEPVSGPRRGSDVGGNRLKERPEPLADFRRYSTDPPDGSGRKADVERPLRRIGAT